MRVLEFPAHFRLLLLAARVRLDAAETDQLRQTAAQVTDWTEFLAVVRSHRVGPLVLRSLEAAGAEALTPAAVLATLADMRRLNAVRAMRVTLEAGRIMNSLDAQGLRPLLIKGVALSQTLYGDPCLRHSGDLDLLTPDLLKEDSDRGRALSGLIAGMAELGYLMVNPTFRPTPQRLANYGRFWKDLTFQHAVTGQMVDLHWRLFNNRHHPANRLVEPGAPSRGAVATIYRRPYETLSRVDDFLYCVAHGVSDNWIYLKALADVAALCSLLNDVEWVDAAGRAAELGLGAQLSSAVLLAGEWLGAPAPAALLDRGPAAERFHRNMRTRVERRLLAERFRPERGYPGPLAEFIGELRLTPGLRSAWELACRFAWRPRVWSRIDLPDRFFWMYPLLGLLTPPRLRQAPQAAERTRKTPGVSA